MNITARELQKTSISYNIDNIVKSLLSTIQSDIIDASKKDLNNLVFQLPTNFDVSSMPNKTAQTIIYSKVLDTLELKGFNVIIEMNKTSVSYIISWVVKCDVDLKKMRNKIASRMIKSKEN